MHEIDTVVSQIVPTIGAAVSAYGIGVLTRAEDKAAGATVRLGQRMLARILTRAAEPEPVRSAVTDLVQDHLDPDALAALRLQLRKALAGDPGLLHELSALLPKAAVTQEAGARGVVIGGTNSGIVATGDGATITQRP